MSSKNPSPSSDPQLAELSKQISLSEAKARVAEANARTAEALAKTQEAALRRMQASKAIEELKAKG
jgi:hypothetical protein